MGFFGRGRGSNHGSKREGGIHASSRKSNSGDHGGSRRDQHGRSRRSNSRERSSSHNRDRDRRRSRDRSRSPLRTQYSKDLPATESLRITVGNDIYKEKTRSPLAGRLGPPVDRSPYNESQSDRRKSDSDNYNRFDGYDQEAKYYDQGDRRQDRDMGRNGGYDSNRQRSREYSSDRYDDRNRDPRDRIDKYSGDGRYPDDFDHRRSGSMDRRDSRNSLERQGGYKEPESDNFFRDIDSRRDADERTERELLGGYKDLPGRDDYPNVYRKDSDDFRPAIPPIPPAPKPLKSILKKKGPTEDTLPGIVTNPVSTPETNLFPIMRPAAKQVIDSSLQQSNEKGSSQDPYDSKQSRPDGRGNSKSGLPGMSSYMDIEDEEKFLYGDDDHEVEKANSSKPGSRPPAEANSRSEDPFYSGMPQRHSRLDSYPADDRFSRLSATDEQRMRTDSHLPSSQPSHLESRYIDRQTSDHPVRPTTEEQLRSTVSSFLEDQRLKQSAYPPTRDIAPVQEKPVAVQPAAFKPDFLSLFTSGNEMPAALPAQIPAAAQMPPTIPYTSQGPPEEPKQKYDPTIENILKSIGFDFEMSRRMQEKANNAQPVQKPKIEEEQFGINQTASFLEGGISDDIKSKLFTSSTTTTATTTIKKEESIVDILMREAKVGPPKSSERRYDSESDGRDRYRSIEQDPPDQGRRSEGYKRAEQDRRLESYGRDRDKSRETDHIDRDRGKEIRDPVKEPASDTYEESTYEDPSLPTESLSSGISFQRQVSRSDTQYQGFDQSASYSQSQYTPAGVSNYTNSSTVPHTQTHSIPPYPGAAVGPVYNAPPPYGFGVPPPGFDPNMPYQTYGNYPPLTGAPFPPTHQPPPGFTGPPPNHNSSYQGPPPHSIPPQTRSSTDKMDVFKEEIQEKKTITLEKKTIKIAPMETSRTVIPPKIDKPKGTLENQSKEPPRKVLTPKEKNMLLKEKEQRRQKIEVLEGELDKLRKQQNEMMRKIRRQKDGHKDPVLLQNNKLQDEISSQLSKLRKAAEENLKILKECKIDPNLKPELEKEDIFEDNTNEKKTPLKKVEESQKQKEQALKRKEEAQKRKKNEQARVKKYEFFDPGGHWCKVCNTESGSIYSVLQHLHGKKHQQAMNPYDRPWVPKTMKSPVKHAKNEHLAVLPVKGQEFLVPCKAFYCTLCKEFAGDEACADFHIKTDSHYQNYLKHLEMNEFYEQRRGLDKATGRSGNKVMKKEDRKEKNEQKKQRVQEKEKMWEKPVDELEIEQPAKKPKISPNEPKNIKTVKSGDGFGKFSFSTGDKDKTKSEEESSEDKESKEAEVTADGKSKIAINIVNKMGIKPIVPAVKVPIKKNPLLPPWTPVSKQESQKQAGGKVEAFPLRKGAAKTEPGTGKPSSLDMFLTLEDKSKPLPVMKEKPKVTAQDILKAFTGKLKDENAAPTEKKNDTNESKEKKLTSQQKEEMADMKMLGIDPASEKPLAAKKPPPPPSQNLSLPPTLHVEKGKLGPMSVIDMDIPLPPSAPPKEPSSEEAKVTVASERSQNDNKDLPMEVGNSQPAMEILSEKPLAESSKALPLITDTSAEAESNAVAAESDDIDDGVSECSEFSMQMGSDFEVVDECEADES